MSSIKGKNKKKVSERIHAKRRAFERYGLVLNAEKYNQIIQIIRSGRSVRSYRQSNTRSIHRLTYEGVEMDAVYDKLRRVIVTFLPIQPKIDEETENSINLV